MRLSAFILHDIDGILRDWETFAARQLPAARDMAPLELRDHAREILRAVAEDLDTAQTRREQLEKSQGRAPVDGDAPETAAQTHAVLRAHSGFDIKQLVAEYRALRASVLRRWLDAVPPSDDTLDDMMRFNEAIDQAIAESVSHFSDRVERARDLLLGMLGHDMRSPLNTIGMTATHLARLNVGEEVSTAAARLMRSGASMRALLDDLMDFNRTRLGLGIHVKPADIDLARVVHDELEQLRAAHPARRIEASMPTRLLGCWDGARLQQVLRNLVLNAAKHGSPDKPIRIELHEESPGIRLDVLNSGAAIDEDELDSLFEPLRRGPASGPDVSRPSDAGLGLGLFIVREIVSAHGGRVEVSSLDETTRFSVRLPR